MPATWILLFTNQFHCKQKLEDQAVEHSDNISARVLEMNKPAYQETFLLGGFFLCSQHSVGEGLSGRAKRLGANLVSAERLS